MRHILEIAAAAAVAFGVIGIDVQRASAESQSSAAASHAPSDIKAKTLHRRARAHRQTSPTNGAAPTEAAPTGAAVFLSDAWLKQEKQTDDRLKRFMNICKGC